MKEPLEEIREQIRNILNVCGPFELQVTDLQEQMAEIRASLGERIDRVESASSPDSFTIEELKQRTLDLLERVMSIEQALKIPPSAVSEESP